MRLFETGGFYLHDSPRLSAEWLNDKDTLSQTRNTSVLLSTIIQYHTLERNIKLCKPEPELLSSCSDVTMWAMASVHSLAWLIDYYESLTDKSVRLFDHKPYVWEYKRELRSYLTLGCFDSADVNPREWLPLSPSEAREDYANEVKRYTFRKVALPYWFPDCKAKRETVWATPADLGFDLTPLDAL